MAPLQQQPIPSLTPRERDVLRTLCRPVTEGAAFAEPASVAEIAGALFVSEAAVKQHLLHLYEKFGMWEEDARHRRSRLANEAVRLGALDASTSPQAELKEGRRAAAERSWTEAFELLSRVDETEPLAPQDLELLGEAATWSAHHEPAVAVRTRAHAAYLQGGDMQGAARAALGLVINHVVRLQTAVASGWLAKASRHLEGEDESREHGQLAAIGGLIHAVTGHFDTALDQARRAYEIARRLEDQDVIALSLALQGELLMRQGRLDQGRALLDEAMASATGGGLGPFATGIVYCRTICACLDTFDFARALQWTEEITRCEAATSAVGFPGDCQTHRATLDIVRGRWSEGEEEARGAYVQTGMYDLNHSATATAMLGRVRLLLGDLDGAEEAFRRAVEMGDPAQPDVSLLRLASGDVAAATVSITAALADAGDALARAKLLPAWVEIALAAGDVEGALAAAGELEGIASGFDSTALHAAAACARGAAELGRGQGANALKPLRTGARQWREIGAPYELARARELVGRALRALGDEASAAAEFHAAIAEFERLGASRDADRARALAEDTAIARP